MGRPRSIWVRDSCAGEAKTRCVTAKGMPDACLDFPVQILVAQFLTRDSCRGASAE
jgi:hypothetical protein